MSDVSPWSEFAVAMAGVAAVLAGLVFVALSVNLDRILSVPGLPGRAGESVILFLSAVVCCAFLLVPDQSGTALGVELLAVGVLEWLILVALTVTGWRSPSRQPWVWNASRFLAGQLAALPTVVAGLLLLIHPRGALYWLASSVLWAIVAGTANAWVLVVEVVRDDRYRPIGETL